ncbi:hypothetical protein OEZ85_010340 [Tetradesmus obliquus]|uniref:Peptidase M1 membrane alanine aminopeptidase domain-containing protein n=1 Tax=Tetradesmus obliquus TaxID=3088 RepID=A0ABY8TP46_TETOB|nr:hypothetical protein OEZ85_010340 [Tetradesmus obliquus]
MVLQVGTAALISINSTSSTRQYRACYTPPTHLIPSTQLSFNINGDNVTVTSTLTINPNPQWRGFLRSPAAAAAAELGCGSLPGAASSTATAGNSSSARKQEAAADGAVVVAANQVPPLVLNGEGLELLDIRLDGQPLPQASYTVTDSSLALLSPPERQFTLQTTSRLSLRWATGSVGLARSISGTYITQCEPEGFRRLTYFLDRPDVRSNFTVRVEADERECPVLLSNGNLRGAGTLPGGRHYAVYEDPLPKPSYLFALAAGPLVLGAEGSFSSAITGRTTALRVYAPWGYTDQVTFALHSLQQSMAWDEAMFGRHFDLELYSMVATEYFPPTGMENQGLSFYQLSNLAAALDTHTDSEAQANQQLVAHEFLHECSAAAAAASGWQRVLHAQRLRQTGSLFDDLRPDSFRSPSMLYTATVYDKGAEVVRMYYTLLGVEGFARGLRSFFDTHDLQSVTFNELHASLAAASPGTNLTGLLPWLANDAPPRLTVSSSWDQGSGMLSVTVHRRTRQEDAPLVPLKAQLLQIPSVSQVSPRTSPEKPLLVHQARAARAAALGMLGFLQDARLQRHVEARYYNASNLSDRLTAFEALEGTPAYNRTLAHFESTYSSKPMALAKWFRVQASSDQPNNTNAVRGLMQHATFDASEYAICSAVLMGFSDSVVNFHAADGSGYRFLADAVLQVDDSNSFCAARAVRELGDWSNCAEPHRRLMCGQLARLAASASSLSDDTADAVKSAADGCPTT